MAVPGDNITLSQGSADSLGRAFLVDCCNTTLRAKRVTVLHFIKYNNETICNTMNYTLGEAAKATGKSKPTIQRAIKSGKISASKSENGSYEIDPSELHRIFPALHRASNDTGTMKQSVTPDETAVLHAKMDGKDTEISLLKARIDELQSDRDEWRDQAKTATRLLEDHRTKESSAKPGFWLRLFG
mgnify:CR=1 FL=1